MEHYQMYLLVGELCIKIMQKEHDLPMLGHHGKQTTKVAVRKRFYRIEMKQDVEHFVCIYVKCQRTKSMYKKKYGLVRPLLIVSEQWENVSMDS
jgi:translation initiation factor 2 beta subunit (eIF-2beta)/eIF-5